MQQGIAALRAAGDTSEFANFDPDDLPFTCPDELITTVIDGQEFNAQKRAALAAHATQISLDGGFFALSNNLGTEVLGKEYFRRVVGAGPDNETDLFAGVNPA
jgi:N-acetyl-1-D-myo-inositol-2-amino-2-deoxy-alpha-D-glucopyranoside deacetylase